MQIKMNFADDSKPILEALRPVDLELWRQEGLFKTIRRINLPEIFVGDKIKELSILRGHIFNVQNNPQEVSGGQKLPRMLVLAERKVLCKHILRGISDETVRSFLQTQLVKEKMDSARDVIRENRLFWPQFVEDFNIALQIWIGERNESKKNSEIFLSDFRN